MNYRLRYQVLESILRDTHKYFSIDSAFSHTQLVVVIVVVVNMHIHKSSPFQFSLYIIRYRHIPAPLSRWFPSAHPWVDPDPPNVLLLPSQFLKQDNIVYSKTRRTIIFNMSRQSVKETNGMVHNGPRC